MCCGRRRWRRSGRGSGHWLLLALALTLILTGLANIPDRLARAGLGHLHMFIAVFLIGAGAAILLQYREGRLGEGRDGF